MILYDKLKNLSTEEEEFDFICPTCKANGMKKNTFTIKPLGISWKPDLIKNEDINNEQLRKGYNNLPTLSQALIKSYDNNLDTTNVFILCNKCNSNVPINKKLKLTGLKKWIKKNIPEVLNLKMTKEEIEEWKMKRQS